MNWKLIFALSLFGAAMSVATVFVIPSNVEPLFWLVIFVICALVIARRAPGKFFLHGFLVSLLNGVWITAAHILLYRTYLANHPREAAMTAKMPFPDSPRLMMALTGPVIAAISGLVLGLFAFAAARIPALRRKAS